MFLTILATEQYKNYSKNPNITVTFTGRLI